MGARGPRVQDAGMRGPRKRRLLGHQMTASLPMPGTHTGNSSLLSVRPSACPCTRQSPRPLSVRPSVCLPACLPACLLATKTRAVGAQATRPAKQNAVMTDRISPTVASGPRRSDCT
jgi:hypothetical protein